MSAIPISRFLIACTLLVSCLNLQAGDKLKRLYRNVVALENKTLLVPMILPDPFHLQKLEKKKKGAEKVESYLKEIAQANENLRRYLDAYFDYTQYEFVDLSQGEYASRLETYDPRKYAILQFGTARQFAASPPKKLGGYYTKVLGVFDTDIETPLLLIPGRLDQFHKKEYAEMMVNRLNETLHSYREKARKKGIRVKNERDERMGGMGDL